MRKSSKSLTPVTTKEFAERLSYYMGYRKNGLPLAWHTFHWDYVSCPHHGYLKVPPADLVRLGIRPNFISEYSARGYYEEDCDATAIIATAVILGAKVRINETTSDTCYDVHGSDGGDVILYDRLRDIMKTEAYWDAYKAAVVSGREIG